MSLEYTTMKRSEMRAAAEVAARAFDDYDYFTIWFPDDGQRRRFIRSVIWHEYKTNFHVADYLVARKDGALAAVAQLNPPDYRKPSDLRYFLHGWLGVYRCAERGAIDGWLAMDAAAGKPCHDYQKTGPGIWYASSLTVDPAFQGTGIGSGFLSFWESYVRERGGRQLVFFTNSEKNLRFYEHHGFEVFDERVLEHNGRKMGSWSLRKIL